MWAQKTHRVLKSQQIGMSIKYTHCLNATYPPGHHHSGFMVTDAIAALAVAGAAVTIEPLVACSL